MFALLLCCPQIAALLVPQVFCYVCIGMLPCPGKSHRQNYWIVYFIAADPYKPSLVTVTGRWVITMYRWYIKKTGPTIQQCQNVLRKRTTFDTVQSYIQVHLLISNVPCTFIPLMSWFFSCDPLVVYPPTVIHHQPVRFGIPNRPSTIKRGHHQGKVFLGTLALQKKNLPGGSWK